MARSLPKIEPGLLSLSGDSLQALLLTFFVKQVMKDDVEEIAIAELVSLTKEPRDRIVLALWSLTRRGCIAPPEGIGWDDVESFNLSGLRLVTEIAEETSSGQQLMNFQTRSREERLEENIEKDGVFYRVEVAPFHDSNSDGLLYTELTIFARDDADADWLVKVQSERVGTVHDAFAWWDEWLAASVPSRELAKIEYDPEQVVVWAKALKAKKGVVKLSPDAYDAALKAFAVASSVGSDVEVETDGTVAFSCLWRKFEMVDIGGIELPDFSTLEEEAEVEPAHLATFTLDDGTQVKATAYPKGRGLYTAVFFGAISQSGEHTKDIRGALMKPDFATWAKNYVEFLRKTYTTGQVGV